MVNEELVLRVRADLSQLNKDLKSATKEKLKIGVDSIPQTIGSATVPTQKRGIGTTMEGMLGGTAITKGATAGTEATGSIGTAMSGALAPVITALAPLAVLGLVATSSGALMAGMKQLLKVVQLILKPIGDILSVGIMPLIQILRPLGKLFNAMMKPYMTKAREAMQIGGKFLKEGDYKDAGKAYMLGFSYMMKPFFDLMTISMGEIAKAPLRIVQLLGKGFVDLGDKMGWLGEPLKAMGNAMVGASTNMMAGIDEAADAIIQFTDDALDSKLGNMLGTLIVKTGETTGDVVQKFKNMGLSTDSLTAGIEESLKTHLENMGTLSATEATKVESNVLTALGALSVEAGTPMNGLKDVVIGYLTDIKNEANSILRDAERKQERASEAMNRTVAYAKQVYSFTPPSSYYGYATDKLGQGVSTMYQTGTKFVPETGQYTLHRGERVMNRTEKDNSNGSVSFGDINITVNGGRGLDENEIASKVKEEIFNELDLRVGG